MKRAADTDTLPSPSKKKAKTSTEPAARSQFRDVDREHVVSSGRAWRTFDDELPGGNVLYLPDFLNSETANELLKELEGLDTCKSRSYDDLSPSTVGVLNLEHDIPQGIDPPCEYMGKV